ncbi:MAG: 3-methyl-2-oxobutanoate hydroxymethyltransferase [Firmicutes bacterium]|nr:3-methyl-2-oxobutanoate hydroxymethyltransferase [Bacillota bacterium]
MAKKKMSILDFKKYKEEGKKFTYVTAYDYTMASIINDSETEVILVGDSLGMIMLGYAGTTAVTMEDMIHHTRPVVKGAPDTFIIGDMPFGSYNESIEQAIRNCSRLMKETGCDAIKLEGGADYAETIKAIVKAGVPVCGHIGLTPQTTSSLGGFKVQGGTPESAKKLIDDAKALEEAGCFGIVLECVPTVVGEAVSKAVSIPIMGIGAGPGVDCQVQVTQDMLGMYGDFKPKHAKFYAEVRKVMVDALNEFHKETQDGSFPTEENSFNKQVDLSNI